MQIKIHLDQLEYNALMQASDKDIRTIPDQARFILRSELQRCGLLQEQPAQPQQQPAPAEGQG